MKGIHEQRMTKPPEQTDMIGELHFEPAKVIEEYFASILQTQQIQMPPLIDIGDNTTDQMILKSEREHAAMLVAQKELLKYQEQEQAINDRRKLKIENMHKDLNRGFVEVNNFLAEYKEKKKEAEYQIAEQIKIQAEHRHKIKDLKWKNKELTDFREILQATVDEYEPYEKVLKEVVEVSQVFSSEKDLLDRCDGLMLAQTEIIKLEKEKLKESTDIRVKLVGLTKQASLKVQAIQTELGLLGREMELARNECMKWEKALEEAQTCCEKQSLLKQCAYDGLYTLYRTLCRRRHMDPILKRDDVAQQLDFIREEVIILQTVRQKCKKAMKGRTDKTTI